MRARRLRRKSACTCAQGRTNWGTSSSCSNSATRVAPSVAAAYAKDELIAIFTANSTSLEPMRELIKEECGIDPDDKRFVIVGCQDVPIFGKAVADGLKVDWEAVTPRMVKLAQDTVKANPDLRAIIFECTELPPYSDAAVRSPPRDAKLLVGRGESASESERCPERLCYSRALSHRAGSLGVCAWGQRCVCP